jgi:hypothetical protein
LNEEKDEENVARNINMHHSNIPNGCLDFKDIFSWITISLYPKRKTRTSSKSNALTMKKSDS